MKLFLVMGETGEYEDHHSWPVKAYLNKRLAEHHVKRAEQRGREIICQALQIPVTDDLDVIQKAERDYGFWEEVVDNTPNEWDSNFHTDYTRETTYYVSRMEIELDDTPPDTEPGTIEHAMLYDVD